MHDTERLPLLDLKAAQNGAATFFFSFFFKTGSPGLGFYLLSVKTDLGWPDVRRSV